MVSPSKKKKVDRRTKTGPSPSNSSVAVHSAADSGTRRSTNKPLVQKPLANRRIYLDIKNHASVKKLSEKLIALGGKLELFLVREVDYVVTDREPVPTKRRPILNQVPTPSPLPSFCSVSPATTDSPTDGLGNKKTRSRAEAMLERVKQQPQKNTTGDILDNALSWKIPIYPLAKFLGWLERFSYTTETLFKDKNTSSNSPPAGRSVKVLTGSYLKIETGSRPEFKLFSNWPSLGLSAPVARSVTSATAHHTQEKVELRNVNTNKKELNSNEPSQRMTRKVGRTTAKEASSAVGGGNGYCEICRIYYDQLDSHTVSAQHLKLVTDSTQYSQLDSIIQQNNLGSNSLRKSLRIAKSPPPFLPPEMGGKQSSGSNTATPGALEMPPKDLARGLRLKECSVSLGPPSPLLNGFTTLKSPRSVAKQSSTTAAASPVPPLHIVMNGCSRRSQRTHHQPLNDILPDKEVNDVLPATPVKDRNLRSRKANSAQTPITPAPPERLPSPPPEKLSPPHLRSGSEKAMSRSDRSLRGSEDRALTVRCSVEKERTWVGGCKSSEKEKSHSGRSSYTPVEAMGMTTRSFRERSVDTEFPAKTSPSKSLEKPERPLRQHERPRRVRYDKDERSEEDESHKKKRKEPTPEEDFREERRKRREEKTCALRGEDDDKEKTQSHSSSRDRDRCSSHDRAAKSERSLRVKERPYYEEFESEESSPVYPSRPGRPPKATHKKKRVSTKSRLTKKRLSVEEKFIEDNKSYYKVEVLNSKLRSTEYFVNQKQAEERVNGDVAVDEVKPVVVRFKKIRSTELALLSDEAENFMFGESKKEDSDEEDEDEEDAQEGSEGETRIKQEQSEVSSDRHSALKSETESSSHSDLIAVKPLSSGDLARQVKEEEAECEDEEVIEEEVAKLTYSFERPPIREPWVDAVTRQREGREFYIPMSHGYPKVILPYEVKKQRKRGRKSESGTAPTPNPSSTAIGAGPSSPFHRKDRVSRLIQASIIDDKPRKSPRRRTSGKREVSASGVAPVLFSDNNTLKTSEEVAIEPEERCHASTLAIMSTLMRRRPMRECAEKLVSYEEESSLPETVESSGSNSNSMDAKVLRPASEVSRVPPTCDFELPPGGDKIAEALLMGFTHLDNYEPASCLQVDPACLNDDLPSFPKPGLNMPVEEILRTYSSCTSMNLEDNFAPVRTFPSFYRNQADSCASSDCSDFLGFMEDGQAATKKRKKRRNLTGWPVEKPRRKLKDKDIGSSCLLLNNRALTPEPARLTSAAVTPLSASSPVRRRCGRPSKIRPCLSATLPIPSPLASDHPPSPASDSQTSTLPVKKKISRFGSRRSILK